MGQKLLDLIDGYPMADVTGTLDRDISSIAYDSRKVEPEGLFVAMSGHHHDGGRFIGQAIEKQAGAFVTGTPGLYAASEDSEYVTFDVGSGSYTFQISGKK